MSEPLRPNPPLPRPHWGVLSLVIFVIGLLIVVPSGLCTALFGVGFIAGGGPLDETLEGLLMVVMYGGIPTLIGGVLVYVGLAMRREK